jgi:hypothetical protein
MSAQLIAYNAFAALLGWPEMGDADELMDVDFKGRRPIKLSDYYSVDEQRVIAELFSVLSGLYMVKLVGGGAVELYTSRHPAFPTATNIALDVKTHRPIEYYTVDDDKERKHDAVTGELLQTNTYCRFDELPEDFRYALAGFGRKSDIYLYARKSYGRIVECRCKSN